MGDSIDPKDLVSLPELAKEFGYQRTYVSKLAAAGKIRAWLVGNSWVTTRKLFKEYIDTNPKPGRPRQATINSKAKKKR